MLQWERSAMRSIFIKPTVVIIFFLFLSFFEWLLMTSLTVVNDGNEMVLKLDHIITPE